MNEKLPKPLAICSGCGEIRRSIGQDGIGKSHRKTKYGDKCKGVWLARQSVGDWEECPSCQATGTDATGSRCTECVMFDVVFGWLPNR